MLILFFRFGICCVFFKSVCGSNVERNCSYISNPNFPNAYFAADPCSYEILKLNSGDLKDESRFLYIVDINTFPIT